MFRFVPRLELALTDPLSDERSVEDATSYPRDSGTRPLLRVSLDDVRAVSVPEGRVLSGILFSSALLTDSVPPGWKVLAAGICCA
jgi:hypothetical protein